MHTRIGVLIEVVYIDVVVAIRDSNGDVVIKVHYIRHYHPQRVLVQNIGKIYICGYGWISQTAYKRG